MGDRGARNEEATDVDIATMARIVQEAIEAGALGFSTSRTEGHRAIDGEAVPGTYAAEQELFGLGRAMGETIAVALVVGSAVNISPSLFAHGYSIPAIIVNQFPESSGAFTAALIGLGVVLFAITIIVNYTARFVVRRAEIRMRGAAA